MKTRYRNKQSRFPHPHPLKERFKRRKITLWMLRDAVDISESQLSRYFNNIDPMPWDLEKSLYRIVRALEGDLSWVDNNQLQDDACGKSQNEDLETTI
jgi:hypothetical protein